MSGDFAHIARCLDLQDQDVGDAIGTRERTRGLLKHLSALSAPNTGVAKVLLVFARMATTACDWLDGDLSIELRAEGDETTIETATDLGGGLRERVFAPLAFKAPIAEFQRAIDRVPHMISPLTVRAKGPSRIALTVTEAIRKTSVPPPPIEIATDSLYVRVSAPSAPKAPAPVDEEPPLPVVESRGRAKAASTPAASSPPGAPQAPSVPPVKDIDSGWDD
jgi:hypothetical protein